MNRTWRGILISILTAGALAPALALGTSFIQTNAFSLGRDESLNSELWLMANQVTLNGNVRDDVFVLAAPPSLRPATPQDGLVTLGGVFHNDVWAMGNSVVLTGIIEDHARFMAHTIILSGSISRPSLFVGNSIHLTRAADIAADAWLGGEDLIVEGWVEGDLTLVGKNVTLAGACGQDVHVTAQDLVVKPGTEIMGNLVYRCPREFVPDKRVVVHGRVIRETIPERAAGFSLQSFIYQSWLFLGALLAAMLFIAIFPVFTARAVQNFRRSPWKCMATGAITLGLVPLAAIVLTLSLVGIPLALVLIASLACMVYLAKITVALALGLWLLRRPNPRSYAQFMMPLIIGLLFIYVGVSSGLPGMAVWVVITSIGLGSLVQTIFSSLFQSQIIPGSSNPLRAPPSPPIQNHPVAKPR